MFDVTLACNIHDPDGRLRKYISRYIPRLSKIYSGMHIVVTTATDSDLIEELEKQGVVIHSQEGKGVGAEFIGDARRQALRASLKTSHGHTHFADFDRIIRWAETYPEELRSIVESIPEHDFLIIGRTKRAFNTHPRSQTETEKLPNKVCSLLLGREVDITAASRGISKRAAEIILRYSRSRFCETDSEWPIIIHCKSELSIGYVEAEGLEYEDWRRYREEVKKAGGLEKWKGEIDGDPDRWMHRIRYVKAISETAISTYYALTKC